MTTVEIDRKLGNLRTLHFVKGLAHSWRKLWTVEISCHKTTVILMGQQVWRWFGRSIFLRFFNYSSKLFFVNERISCARVTNTELPPEIHIFKFVAGWTICIWGGKKERRKEKKNIFRYLWSKKYINSNFTGRKYSDLAFWPLMRFQKCRNAILIFQINCHKIRKLALESIPICVCLLFQKAGFWGLARKSGPFEL